jgi:hypothetical protein
VVFTEGYSAFSNVVQIAGKKEPDTWGGYRVKTNQGLM